jgi:hypothetical protein
VLKANQNVYDFLIAGEGVAASQQIRNSNVRYTPELQEALQKYAKTQEDVALLVYKHADEDRRQQLDQHYPHFKMVYPAHQAPIPEVCSAPLDQEAGLKRDVFIYKGEEYGSDKVAEWNLGLANAIKDGAITPGEYDLIGQMAAEMAQQLSGPDVRYAPALGAQLEKYIKLHGELALVIYLSEMFLGSFGSAGIANQA